MDQLKANRKILEYRTTKKIVLSRNMAEKRNEQNYNSGNATIKI